MANKSPTHYLCTVKLSLLYLYKFLRYKNFKNKLFCGTPCIYRQRSNNDKSSRVTSKTLPSRGLKLECFFYDQREHFRQSALRHHRLAKEKKDAFKKLQADN